MKPLNLATLIILIIGGINLGLVGLLQFDVIALVFGGAGAMLTRLVYILIGAAALWQLYPLVRAVQTDEILAESAAHR